MGGISCAGSRPSELPFPPPGDLLNPGIEPKFPESPALAGRFFTTEPPEKPHRRGAWVQSLVAGISHMPCSTAKQIKNKYNPISLSFLFAFLLSFLFFFFSSFLNT